MKRVLWSALFWFGFWFLLVPWAFLHYGSWIDATQKPVKSDLIVCLGGGTKARLDVATKLYAKGYAPYDVPVVLVGESYDTPTYLKEKYPDTPIRQHHGPRNTKEEVYYIKNYMVKHGYKRVLIVTDPPHSRRVNILFSILDVKEDEDLALHLVASNVKWWKAKKYYDDKRSGETVLSETIRILYSLLCYGVLEKLGVRCE
jgi:hypothetical protein